MDMLKWLSIIGKIVLVTLALSFTCVVGYPQSESKNEQAIQGKLLLDSIWEPVVYLSHIPTFNDMFTMSGDMIIAEAQMDANGYFSIPSLLLPENDNLFRLHVSKKGAPAASLIIGGVEENHIFFIANNKNPVHIRNHRPDEPFIGYEVNGYAPNYNFMEVDNIVAQIDSIDYGAAGINREFATRAIREKLRQVADTSSHPLVSLYALHHSKFESTYLENQKFYTRYLEKWEGENSSYFQAIRAKIPEQEGRYYWWLILVAIGFFMLGFGLQYRGRWKKQQNENLLKTLSVQERKIFQLIQSGKSNKEISDTYNIGLSTVKSHVSSIYAKLNINSRKEAIDY